MTTEEAINTLKELRDEWNRHSYPEGVRKTISLDMAIEVLRKEPSKDCVDRHSVELLTYRYLKEPTDDHVAFYEELLDLPSVNLQKSKTGHWIYDEEHSSWYDTTYECSCCKRAIIVPYDTKNEIYKNYPYCHCGAKMIKPQESEDKE